MQIKPIIQKETSGCGIACVAMLAGTSYDETKRIANQLGINAEDEKLWSETNYVRKLLNEYGIEASPSETQFTGWDALPDLALLAIKYRIENGRPLWHWVVFCRQEGQEVVLDPAAYLEKNERTDFDAMKPQWFIEFYCG